MLKAKNIKEYYINKNIKQQKLNYTLHCKNSKQERFNDLKLRLWENLTRRIWNTCNNKNITRNLSYKVLIGCNEEFLYNYLENLLSNDLTMNDYPKWEIDHIKPISKYDLTIESEQLTARSFSSKKSSLRSQLLWANIDGNTCRYL